MRHSKMKEMATQAMDQLITAVEAGKSEKLKAYLAMLGRFHRYSPRNVMLIAMQCANASRVAGYRRWKELGRQVRQGERAIRILAPIVRRKKEESVDEEKELVAFKAACVFDIAQTQGEELPEFAEVRGDPREFMAKLKEFIAGRGIKLEYSNRIGPALGMSTQGMILLRRDMDRGEEFSTLVHEAAHEILHQDIESRPSRTIRETEAEAVAFVVCQGIGLDANDASADYIQLYDGDKRTLIESLERIHATARKILDGLLPDKEDASGMVRDAVAVTEAA